MINTIILAGGIGSRLWPISTASIPKQFTCLPENNYCCLFEQTLNRVKDFSDFITVIINIQHFNIVQNILEKFNSLNINIIVEPLAKNTLYSVISSLLLNDYDDDSKVFITPCDHIIKDFSPFSEQIINIECDKELITFGIRPTYPEVNYGYINPETGVFHEKPDLKTAYELCSKGYLWNSGMFLGLVKIFKEVINNYNNQLLELINNDIVTLLTKQKILMIPEDCYYNLENISFDKAVEKYSNVKCYPLMSDWLDVGNYQQFIEWMKNINPSLNDQDNNWVYSPNNNVKVIGLKDVGVVNYNGNILVFNQNKLNLINSEIASGNDSNVSKEDVENV